MFTPFDFNEAVAHRKEYIEEGLRDGSPVVGLKYDGGLMLLTIRRSQRKVYEIYDRQMFSAIGKQSDIETVRLNAIQRAHQEGFERSPDDVSVQRLVGFFLSPALKQAFGDQFGAVPFVVRALFAETGRTGESDIFVTLNYDGETRERPCVAVVAGSAAAEDAMQQQIGTVEAGLSRDDALRRGLAAWITGARESRRGPDPISRDDDDLESDSGDRAAQDAGALLRAELKDGALEVGVLEKSDHRESRFRLLRSDELEPAFRDYS